MTSILDEVLWARFAAAALGGLLAGAVRRYNNPRDPSEDAAITADAMLDEFRKRFPKPEGK